MYMIVFSAQGHRLEHILVYLRKKLFCNVKKIPLSFIILAWHYWGIVFLGKKYNHVWSILFRIIVLKAILVWKQVRNVSFALITSLELAIY